MGQLQIRKRFLSNLCSRNGPTWGAETWCSQNCSYETTDMGRIYNNKQVYSLYINNNTLARDEKKISSKSSATDLVAVIKRANIVIRKDLYLARLWNLQKRKGNCTCFLFKVIFNQLAETRAYNTNQMPRTWRKTASSTSTTNSGQANVNKYFEISIYSCITNERQTDVAGSTYAITTMALFFNLSFKYFEPEKLV